MIRSNRIRRTLLFLEDQYNQNLSSSDELKPVLASKMALLEFCGWIEETFDEIARNCVRKRLRTLASRQPLEKKIKDTHGFHYDSKAKPLLIAALGVEKYLKVEKQLEKCGQLAILKSELGTLNKSRQEAAHTFTSGRTSHFATPSVLVALLNRIETILQNLWELVRNTI